MTADEVIIGKHYRVVIPESRLDKPAEGLVLEKRGTGASTSFRVAVSGFKNYRDDQGQLWVDASRLEEIPVEVKQLPSPRKPISICDLNHHFYSLTVEDCEETHPGFTITCKNCGSKRVYHSNTMGFSEESGNWGGILLTCADCEKKVVLFGED